MANKAISTLPVGSIIKLNESGNPVEFYVCKHDYESELNGSGRTLVVRKDCYDTRRWHSSNVNAYASSAIDSWLNSTYKNLLDADIRGVIGTTKIKYTPGNGNNTVGTLQRAIFLLSATELNRSASWFNVEGTALEIASSLQIAYMNGSAVVQWTRSPNTDYTNYAVYLYTDGNVSYSYCTSTYGSRPAFTLPSTTQVDDSGNVVTVDLTAHKTLINGTAYTVQGGKCLVNGTVYNILKGRTLIGGTGYDITFAPPFPRKGDLITMNLDGTDRLYRVLKIVDGTTVEVLGMWDGLSSSFISDLNGSNIYAGSPLDSYLNTTWYNTLSSNAKAAIVPKNISQYQYKFNSSVYNQTTHASYADYNSKSLKSAILYERNIYTLDIEDIEEYFGGTAGSVSLNTPGKFSGDDLVTLFWNTTAPGFIYMWLRSAAQDSSPSVWQVAGFYKQIAQVIGSSSKPSYIARPAFQIDLSKIDFTIN